MRETVTTLRKKVLTLAVTGQLVHQDQAEGTGEELYQAIQKVRADAAKTATVRKKNTKPLPPITTEEIPFEIPENWKLVRLGEVCEFIYGKGLEKKFRPEDGPYPAYGANGVLSRSTKYNCKHGGIIIGRKGSAGALTRVDESFYALDVTYYVPKDQFAGFEIEYLFNLLSSLNLPGLAGGVKPGLNRDNAYKKIIGLPPLAEQRRIVAKVEEIMQTLDLIEQEANDVESLLDLLEKRILTEAVSGRLVPQNPTEGTGEELYERIQKVRTEAKTATGRKKNAKPLPPITPDEVPFEIPATWKWVRLGEIVDVQTGKLDANAASDDGQYPFFTCADAPLKIDRYAYDTECVLLAGNGNFNVKYYKGKFEAYQRTYIIEPASDSVYAPYLYHLVQMNIERYKNTSLGSTMPFIRLAYITEAMAPLPPLAEQRRIVAKVDEATSLIKHLRVAVK